MVEEERIAQVLLGVRHLVGADGIEFRYGQTEGAKMARHIDKGAILVAVGAHDTDNGATAGVGLTGVYAIGALLLYHNIGLSVISRQHSDFSIQHSDFCYQPSAFRFQTLNCIA